MRYDAAWPGRVFEWKEEGNLWRPGSETLYVTLNRWTEERLKVLVLHSTYAYHKAGQVIVLRTSDRLWVEAKRIT